MCFVVFKADCSKFSPENEEKKVLNQVIKPCVCINTNDSRPVGNECNGFC